MRSIAIALMMGGCFATVPFITGGCDRTVSHHESTDTTDGKTVHQEDTQKQTPDGTTVTEHKKTVDKP